MEFRVLGRLEIVSDAGESIAVTRPLVRGALFALVLHRNESLSPGRLIELLWGAGASDRLHSLHSNMWNLRQVLPADRLVSDDRGYRLEIGAGGVDLDRFRRLVRDASRARDEFTAARLLSEAMGLWGSGRLSELLPATPAMGSLITGLTEEHRDTRNALIRVRLALGRHRDLLPELRASLSAEPVDEQLWADLMLVLYRCGLKTDALAAFTQARAALSPAGLAGAQLHRLRRQIQADDPALQPEAALSPLRGMVMGSLAGHRAEEGIRPRQLPPGILDFTGRGTQAGELIALLSPKQGALGVPVAEVTGPPGVGKTALAVHVAHAIAHDYPDGQLFVRLGGATEHPAAPEAILGEVLRAVGMDAGQLPHTRTEREAAYRTYLAGRRLLLVLDGAVSPDQVRPLLPGTAGCAVIVTSQVQLVGLRAGNSISLPPLDEDQALDLLARLVGKERIEAEPQAAATVVAACGGLPLAVRIAGERLAARPNWPIAYLARALSDERRRLDELVAGDLAVRASLAFSYQALPARAQRLFRLLALAGQQEVPDWAASALLGEPAADAIDTLVDRSLLSAVGMDPLGQPRYRLHDLLRDYAAELSAEHGNAGADNIVREDKTARARLADGWLELAALADQQLPQPPYLPPRPSDPRAERTAGKLQRAVVAESDAWFAIERSNLIATIHDLCSTGESQTALRLMQHLAAYLRRHGYHDDAEHAWTAIINAAGKAGDQQAVSQARLRAAMVIAVDEGDTARASGPIQACITAFEKSSDLVHLALTFGLRAYCAQAEGVHDRARADAEHGIELARRAQDVHAEFFCLCVLGVSLGELGDHDGGSRCSERAIEIARDLGTGHLSIAVMALIQIRESAGQLHEVIELCRQGLAVFPPSGHGVGRAHFHQHLGLAHQRLGHHTEAIEVLTKATEQFQGQRNPYQTARCLRALADSAEAAGRRHDVLHHLQRSIALFHDHGHTREESEAQARLAAFNGKTHTA